MSSDYHTICGDGESPREKSPAGTEKNCPLTVGGGGGEWDFPAAIPIFSKQEI
jgi:hypothetical protein